MGTLWHHDSPSGLELLAATQEERTLQLDQAAYRGVQDSRTAVRFFRKSNAEAATLTVLILTKSA